MASRKLRVAAALALPVIAAVLVPAGITGCDDDRRRHNTVIVVPEGRHDADQDRRHEAVREERHDSDEHHDRQEHHD